MPMEQDDITIWGGGTPRTFRPIWTAEELGLRYKHLPIGPRTGDTQTEAYTSMNPKQKIPFARDGSLGLSESVAISRHFVNKYGAQAGFYQATDLETQAREDEWVCYIYGELDETSLYVMRRHGDLHEIYGSAPAAVESSQTYALKHLGIVAEHMKSSQYALGADFGLVDIILGSTLDWAHLYGLELPEVLTDYRQLMRERPAYQRAFAVNYPHLKEKSV